MTKPTFLHVSTSKVVSLPLGMTPKRCAQGRV